MPRRNRLKRKGSKARKTRMMRAKDIDVFWHLEELILKKDLDTPDWYHARTIKMVRDIATDNKELLIGFVQNGENVSRSVAEKAVNMFIAEQKLKKGEKDFPYDVTQGEYD